jgi:hypothetical protein
MALPAVPSPTLRRAELDAKDTTPNEGRCPRSFLGADAAVTGAAHSATRLLTFFMQVEVRVRGLSLLKDLAVLTQEKSSGRQPR